MQGGCLCGAVRFEATGEPVVQGQCHCRTCQYISGGMPNVVIGMPESGFSYRNAEVRAYRRSDRPDAATREFCPECGTHLVARTPALPGTVLIKVGTLDDPAVFAGPQIAICTADRQPFHHIPEGLSAFEHMPE